MSPTRLNHGIQLQLFWIEIWILWEKVSFSCLKNYIYESCPFLHEYACLFSQVELIRLSKYQWKRVHWLLIVSTRRLDIDEHYSIRHASWGKEGSWNLVKSIRTLQRNTAAKKKAKQTPKKWREAGNRRIKTRIKNNFFLTIQTNVWLINFCRYAQRPLLRAICFCAKHVLKYNEQW